MNSTSSLLAQLTHLNEENERIASKNRKLSESLNTLKQQKDAEINRLTSALGQVPEERDKIAQQYNVHIAHKERMSDMLKNFKDVLDDRKRYEKKLLFAGRSENFV